MFRLPKIVFFNVTDGLSNFVTSIKNFFIKNTTRNNLKPPPVEKIDPPTKVRTSKTNTYGSFVLVSSAIPEVDIEVLTNNKIL